MLRRPDTGKRASGAIIYRGPSAIDGEPIIVVLVGLAAPSSNSKTGGMLQTHILRADIPPTVAIAAGMDVSVCGDCQYRSRASGGSGTCYVQVGQGPLSVYRGMERGIYPEVDGVTAALAIAESGRGLRIGSYGDPAAIPAAGEFWGPLAAAAPFHTGYTHAAHLDIGESLRGLCHASADSVWEAAAFQSDGWATFRVAAEGDSHRERSEARCPASAEAGHKVTCATCPMRCDGSGVSTVIQAHGATRRSFREGVRA